MTYQVFVSHSVQDLEFVERIHSELEAVGIKAYLFEHDSAPGHSVAAKIQNAIRDSNVVVVLLSRRSAPSPYVQQEVGYAVGQNKLVVPLVEKGVAPNALAMLSGTEYIPFDTSDPQTSTQALTRHVSGLRDKKEREELMLMVALLVGVLILVAISSEGSA